MSKSSLIINGQFFECDIRSLKIEIQGDVNDLSLDVTNASTTIIGNSNTSIAQVFNGNISDGQFGTIIHNANVKRQNNYSQAANIINSNISIHVTGNVDSIETSVGDVYCNQARTIESTSGNISVNGDIQGNAESMSGNINVKGDVKGSVSTMSGNINTKI